MKRPNSSRFLPTPFQGTGIPRRRSSIAASADRTRDMDASRWQRVRQLFDEALTRGPDAAAAFLAQACDGDDALRREVNELLAAHSAAGAFIEVPAVDDAFRLIRREDGRLPAGTHIDRYTIVREIGRGGMG